LQFIQESIDETSNDSRGLGNSGVYSCGQAHLSLIAAEAFRFTPD
jgi:hypothetical protein